jgi:hypothetical protein
MVFKFFGAGVLSLCLVCFFSSRVEAGYGQTFEILIINPSSGQTVATTIRFLGYEEAGKIEARVNLDGVFLLSAKQEDLKRLYRFCLEVNEKVAVPFKNTAGYVNADLTSLTLDVQRHINGRLILDRVWAAVSFEYRELQDETAMLWSGKYPINALRPMFNPDVEQQNRAIYFGGGVVPVQVIEVVSSTYEPVTLMSDLEHAWARVVPTEKIDSLVNGVKTPGVVSEFPLLSLLFIEEANEARLLENSPAGREVMMMYWMFVDFAQLEPAPASRAEAVERIAESLSDAWASIDGRESQLASFRAMTGRDGGPEYKGPRRKATTDRYQEWFLAEDTSPELREEAYQELVRRTVLPDEDFFLIDLIEECKSRKRNVRTIRDYVVKFLLQRKALSKEVQLAVAGLFKSQVIDVQEVARDIFLEVPIVEYAVVSDLATSFVLQNKTSKERRSKIEEVITKGAVPWAMVIRAFLPQLAHLSPGTAPRVKSILSHRTNFNEVEPIDRVPLWRDLSAFVLDEKKRIGKEGRRHAAWLLAKLRAPEEFQNRMFTGLRSKNGAIRESVVHFFETLGLKDVDGGSIFFAVKLLPDMSVGHGYEELKNLITKWKPTNPEIHFALMEFLSQPTVAGMAATLLGVLPVRESIIRNALENYLGTDCRWEII